MYKYNDKKMQKLSPIRSMYSLTLLCLWIKYSNASNIKKVPKVFAMVTGNWNWITTKQDLQKL